MALSPTVLLSKPAIQRDGTSFDGDAYNDGLWTRMDRGRPRKMRGFREITNLVTDLSRGLDIFSRAGSTYVHTAGASKVEQIVFNRTGQFSALNDRTPALLVPSADLTWTLDTIFDPVINNNAMVVAHGAPNLTYIDNNVETAVYWGTMNGTTALTPLGIPALTQSIPIASITGNTTSGSATISGIASTVGLAFGMTVSGAGLPPASYILTVAANSITLQQAATATASGVALTVTTGGVSGGLVAIPPYLMLLSSDGSVQWSTPLAKGNTPADFWSEGSGGAYVTDQKLVAGRKLRGGPGSSPSALLWSLNALLRASFTGGSTVFSFDTISDTVSILSPRSIVEVDGAYYWAGTDRFYMFAGSVRELPNQRNANWFFDGINQAAAQKAFAFVNPRWGEIWFCYPRGTATECSHAAIYNWRTQDWYDTALPDAGRAAAVGPNVFPYPLMLGTDADTTTGRYSLWQHETGTDKVKGSHSYAVRAYIETASLDLLTGTQQPSDKKVRVGRVEADLVQTGDMTMTVRGEANAKAPTVVSTTATIYANPIGPKQQTTAVKEMRRMMRFRFESNVAGGDFQMGKSLAFVEDAGSGSRG